MSSHFLIRSLRAFCLKKLASEWISESHDSCEIQVAFFAHVSKNYFICYMETRRYLLSGLTDNSQIYFVLSNSGLKNKNGQPRDFSFPKVVSFYTEIWNSKHQSRKKVQHFWYFWRNISTTQVEVVFKLMPLKSKTVGALGTR